MKYAVKHTDGRYSTGGVAQRDEKEKTEQPGLFGLHLKLGKREEAFLFGDKEFAERHAKVWNSHEGDGTFTVEETNG